MAKDEFLRHLNFNLMWAQQKIEKYANWCSEGLEASVSIWLERNSRIFNDLPDLQKRFWKRLNSR